MRPLILERLAAMGDLEGEQPHQMVIGPLSRCGTVVEPRLSIQWFVRAGPLAERALASVREGARILPVTSRRCTPTGWRTSTTGRWGASCGGTSDPGVVLPGRPHHRVRCRGGA